MNAGTKALVTELQRIGYRVNGDGWHWNVSDAPNGRTEISDGQESAVVHGDWTATALEAISSDSADSETHEAIWQIVTQQELSA